MSNPFKEPGNKMDPDADARQEGNEAYEPFEEEFDQAVEAIHPGEDPGEEIEHAHAIDRGGKRQRRGTRQQSKQDTQRNSQSED